MNNNIIIFISQDKINLAYFLINKYNYLKYNK